MNHLEEKDIKLFFEGRQGARELFRHLEKAILKICQPEVTVSRTQISYGEKYKYLWVWLPQKWTSKRPEDSIVLTILTGKKPEGKRIVESVQPKKGYWTSHILLENIKDIDSETERLIRESYNFYLERKARKESGKKRKQ